MYFLLYIRHDSAKKNFKMISMEIQSRVLFIAIILINQIYF